MTFVNDNDRAAVLKWGGVALRTLFSDEEAPFMTFDGHAWTVEVDGAAPRRIVVDAAHGFKQRVRLAPAPPRETAEIAADGLVDVNGADTHPRREVQITFVNDHGITIVIQWRGLELATLAAGAEVLLNTFDEHEWIILVPGLEPTHLIVDAGAGTDQRVHLSGGRAAVEGAATAAFVVGADVADSQQHGRVTAWAAALEAQPNWGRVQTQIFLCSAHVGDSGRLEVSLEASRLDAANAVLANAKSDTAPEALLVVGGRSGSFEALDAEGLVRLAGDAVGYAHAHGLAGVVWDWPRHGRDGMAALVGASRAAATLLPGRMKVAATTTGLVDLGAEVWAALDQVHLLAFDVLTTEVPKHGAYHHASLESVAAVLSTISGYALPPSKVLVGLPAFGRGIHDRAVSATYRAIHAEYIRDHGRAPPRDATDAAGIAFDGPLAIEQKVRACATLGFGGVYLHDLLDDLGTGHADSLLRAAYESASAAAEKDARAAVAPQPVETIAPSRSGAAPPRTPPFIFKML